MLNTDKQPVIGTYESMALVLAFVLIRFITIIGLYKVSGGQELASDVVFHELIINDPLGILKGTAVHIASYPPFQWVIEWPLFNFYSMFFGEMISYRLMMVSIEFAAFMVAVSMSRKMLFGRRIALTMLILFIVSPHQYFSSVFFIQEDVIAQLFMLVALMFLLGEKRNHCVVVLVLGVLIAKLFFIVPLFYVILFQGRHAFYKRVMIGILALVPLIAVYSFIIAQALKNGGEVPIRDFTPNALYAANYWVLLVTEKPDLLEYYKNISLLLTAVIQFALVASLLLLNRKRNYLWHPAVLLVLPLAFFFATFYQHMPEYLLMVWPVAALFCRLVWQQIVLAGAMCFAWAPRVTHGLAKVVEGFGTAAEARSEVVGPFVNILSFDFYVLLNQIALIAQSIVYSILVIWLCLLSRKLVRDYNSVSNAQL